MKEKAVLLGIILLIGPSIGQDEVQNPSMLQIFLAKISREPSKALKGNSFHAVILEIDDFLKITYFRFTKNAKYWICP